MSDSSTPRDERTTEEREAQILAAARHLGACEREHARIDAAHRETAAEAERLAYRRREATGTMRQAEYALRRAINPTYDNSDL